MMRYAAYALAIVIGVAGVISGIAAGNGILAGVAGGWIVDSVILIIRGDSAKVEGRDDAVFSIFEGMPPWIWGLCVAILIVGGLVGWLIHH